MVLFKVLYFLKLFSGLLFIGVLLLLAAYTNFVVLKLPKFFGYDFFKGVLIPIWSSFDLFFRLSLVAFALSVPVAHRVNRNMKEYFNEANFCKEMNRQLLADPRQFFIDHDYDKVFYRVSSRAALKVLDKEMMKFDRRSVKLFEFCVCSVCLCAFSWLLLIWWLC